MWEIGAISLSRGALRAGGTLTRIREIALNSIGTEAASNGAKDITYATTGWDRATLPLLRGTPDVNGDGIPDIYATRNDGTLHLFNGGDKAIINGWRVEEDDWNSILTIG
ncbi:hypothetical protein [Streptomyces sp. NPDC051183]|uniref:hypothetical protein n=1 Tax=Streptomyces sp. NPDC051183 TaxID=3155165 RepID=UPI003427ADC3